MGMAIAWLTITARTLADDGRSGVKRQQLVMAPLESYDKLGKEGNNQSSNVELRTTNRNMSIERKKLSKRCIPEKGERNPLGVKFSYWADFQSHDCGDSMRLQGFPLGPAATESLLFVRHSALTRYECKLEHNWTT